MQNSLEKIVGFLQQGLWEIDIRGRPPLQGRLLQGMRLGYVLARDLLVGQLTMRAMSLVYTTLLSIVPLLAVSFSVLKGFGVHNQVQPLLEDFLAPLGQKGTDLVVTIISFINNMHVGVLGSIGVALLFYTVVSLVAKIEDAFNHIWHIATPRRFIQRFSYYFSILLIGPVLVFSALGITATMMSSAAAQYLISLEPFGTITYVIGHILPYLFTIAAFAFAYVLLPNTAVRLAPALVAALVAGLLWRAVGWLFTVFIVGTVKYDAIYSGFAIVIVLLIWLYISWLILLLGAQLSFYLQHPEFVRPARNVQTLSNIAKERLALAVLSLVGGAYLRGQPAPDEDELVRRLGVPFDLIDPVIHALSYGRVIIAVGEQADRYLPARDLEVITLYEVLACVRAAQSPLLPMDPNHRIDAVEQLLTRVDRALAAEFATQTVRQWLLQQQQGSDHAKSL